MEATNARRDSRSNAAWSGIVFAVLFVVGAMAAVSSPSSDVTDKLKDNPTGLAAAWHDYYADSGHRWTIIVGAFMLVAAALALVVFASELRQRLADSGAPGAGRLAFAGSLLFAAAAFAGAAGFAWIPASKQFGSVALPQGDLNYLGTQLGAALLLLGGGAAAAFLLVTSGYAGARTWVLPGWLGWAAVVIGVLLFFLAATFIAMALLAALGACRGDRPHPQADHTLRPYLSIGTRAGRRKPTERYRPVRSRCLHPGQQQGRRCPSSSSSRVRRMRRSRVVCCLASSTQQMNSLRARGVMSFQAASAVGLAISALRRSPGSECTTPPGIRGPLTG